MPSISRARALAYALVLLVVAHRRRSRRARRRQAQPAVGAQSVALDVEEEPPRELVVHVAGAVLQPGLYRLPDGSRVDDAIAEAGGAGPRAALDLVNLAAPVADGQQVVVPAAGSVAADGPGAAEPGAAGRARSTSTRRRSSSSTSSRAWGRSRPSKSIDYRTANGAFRSVDELDAVPGIGPARLEQLRPLVDL